MSRYDWLSQYQYIDGLQQSLSSMDRRTVFESKMENAVNDIQKDYGKYEEEFTLFFDELIRFCQDKK